MNKQARRRGGPRSFDRDEAVETAMRLFWRHGYEGVSVSDLVAAIGIAPPSLYAAFGNKAGLYREALDRYEALPGALTGLAGAETLDEAVEGLLRAGLLAVINPQGERGCMVSGGMVQCADEHAGLAAELAGRRHATRTAIAQGLLRWLDQAGAEALAGHLSAVLQGMSIQARDGASREELQQAADEATAGIRARRLGRGTAPGRPCGDR